MFGNLKRTVGKIFAGITSSGSSWGWMIPGSWSRKHLLQQYTRYVFAIVSAVAEDAAKIEFEVQRKNKQGVMMPIFNHPFYDFIKKPNPAYSQFQFLEMHFTFMELMGESFWYVVKGEKSRKPKEAYLLRPDLMDVVIDEDDPRGLVKGYVLNRLDGKQVPFDVEEVLHFKMPNPLNPYRGLGVVEAAKVYIQTEEFGSTWTRNSIYNSGRPSGVLSIKGTMNDEQYKKIKKQFRNEYSGVENAGKTLILKGTDGIDYQKLGMDLGEVALKEMKDMTRDDIMLMFRVSKTLLGITEDVNYASSSEARAVFKENVIKPKLDRFTDHLSSFMLPVWGEGNILGYSDEGFISYADKTAEWTAGHNKWLTTNDIREERGLDPLPGGDVLYQAINLVPVTEESSKVEEDTNDGNDNQDDSEDEDLPPEEKSIMGKSGDKRQQRAEIFRKQLFDNQAQWEKKYKAEMAKEFSLQLGEILRANKAFTRNKELDNWMFNIEASKQRLIGTFVPLGIELMKDQSKFAFELADEPDLELEVNDRVRDYIQNRIDHMASSTNDETIKKIRDSITEGIQEGESLSQLKKRIRAIYSNASDVRAERIARTETIAASNEAAQEAYRQSPLVVSLEWSTEADGCVYCQALNGKIVGIDETFARTGESVTGTDGTLLPISYESIGHPPLHPNCRCSILPVASKL